MGNEPDGIEVQLLHIIHYILHIEIECETNFHDLKLLIHSGDIYNIKIWY